MSRESDQGGEDARQPPLAADGVVRTAKSIPRMVTPEMPSERSFHEEMTLLPCSGRCGHCDCHPCRLHGPI
ncbi:MAG: hypothetical protein Q8K67_01540 [Geothrix sp.]|nr:hypothetical protein [Geothrix sp.]